jgi:uncharacterized protein (TIGR02453 family)
MIHFTPDFLDFFKELAPNNNKDWFDENRKRYHESVKTPFDNFVTVMIEEMQKLDGSIHLTYKDCVFRINRDIRFSKDKTPYKLNRSAAISPGGRKDRVHPGIYFELTPEHVRVYTGIFSPEKNDLYAMREEIAENMKEFNKIISNKKFKEVFGEVKGDKNARLPKEFQEAGEKQSLMYNKKFYVYTTFSPDIIFEEGLEKKLIEAYKIAEPFAKFLSKPIINIRS